MKTPSPRNARRLAARSAETANRAEDVGTEQLANMTGDTTIEPTEMGQPAPAETETPEPEAGEQPIGDTPEPEAVVAVDPFADLPVVSVGEYEFKDFATIATADPRKYLAAQTAALAASLPIQKGWKHSAAMLTLGRVRKEHKADSVYGTLEAIIGEYGRAGVPAYVVVAKLRQACISNKRSHYAQGALPPIGWAEGYINTFVSKGLGQVMSTKTAPSLTKEAVAELVAISEGTQAESPVTDEVVAQAA